MIVSVFMLDLVAAGAHSTWFHLYRLVLEQPSDMQPTTAEEGQEEQRVQRVALAVEQFLQTSTVGEYEQRLSMVWSFRCALYTPVTVLPGGEGGGGQKGVQQFSGHHGREAQCSAPSLPLFPCTFMAPL